MELLIDLTPAVELGRELYPDEGKKPHKNGDGSPVVIPEGQRDNTLASEAGKLRRIGYTEQEILVVLRVLNAQRCVPPLPDEDLQRIAHSIAQYEPGESAVEWPPPLDLNALAATDPKPPQMIIDDWMPRGYVTLLAGHGGTGKSQITLKLAVCLALGKDFFGLHTQRCRVMQLSCEDREEVLHWRLMRTCADMGVQLADLQDKLMLFDLVGHDSVLFEQTRGSSGPTAMLERLRSLIAKHKPDMLIVDGVADTFGGNEIERGQVKRFCNALLGLMPRDGVVFLIHHVNKVDAANKSNTSEGYSGSTAWHNSARARWYLRHEVDDMRNLTGRLRLELQKTNHGRTDQQVILQWDDDAHVFAAVPETDQLLEDHNREEDELNGIVAAVKEVEASGGDVPTAWTGQRNCGLVLRATAALPAELKNPRAKTRLIERIEQLRLMGRLREQSIRRSNRKWVSVWTAKQAAGTGQD